MKHWRLEDLPWDRFDPTKMDPEIVPAVKAAAMVERNGGDYARYLNSVFSDDPDFRQAADHWAVEEIQHGDALGRWASLADPGWDYAAAFARYREGFKIDVEANASIRGSRSGELIARCMVETGTSSYYTALAEASEEPVLQALCRQIAADEYRHFKLFYDHLKRYLKREDLSFLQRLRIAAGRVGETEDDELAFAYHCANEDAELGYDHARCTAGYMGRAMGFYRFRHIERSMGMMFKTVGLEPRGRMADLAARAAWRLLCWRRDKYRDALARQQVEAGLKLAA
ncbi:ferritin-like domain-containing protein [Siccirubricoccus sp. KC 17139]|uniref:Ferritin-like domain-containing protein n=1 Tax=Siccirubricoccus soli TaxID=2899147 RepID=A0ABT1D3H0_9PROT|nr:ferritin-like domain-containing protein [Siccirubricoccus soli]MCO6416463.1 ferritin-like domain-containing protein [Siccirubricoccus soli]MCP2682597.1 ferritin-like domain-containing protein [Siccirubricoccus soli]